MSANYPKWLQEKESTRKRSEKQEKKLAQKTGGKTRINSGATFGQNDVFSRELDIEAKLTGKKSFTVTGDMWDKLNDRCDTRHIPIMVVEFEGTGKQLAVVDLDELMFLIEKLRSK